MNKYQLAYIVGISLLVLVFIIVTTLVLINTQSPDVIQVQSDARQCFTQIVGNCAIK